jgi:hypothetical protein
LGSSLYGERRAPEAEKHFDIALQIVGTSDYPDNIKAYQKAWIYKTWGETLVQSDCRLSQKYIQKAADLFPTDKRFAENAEWTFIQYQVGWLLTLGSTSEGKCFAVLEVCP